MRRVLAISGKRYAGKDTVANEVVTQSARRGVKVTAHAFAGESKRLFAEWRGDVDLARLLGERAYKEFWRPRLTAFTVAALYEDPLVFCRAVADRIAANDEVAVVTDLRLKLEVVYLRSRFDLRVVRVTRPDALRERSGWRYTPMVDGHPMETELDDPKLWNEEFFNDGSRTQIAKRVSRRWNTWIG